MTFPSTLSELKWSVSPPLSHTGLARLVIECTLSFQNQGKALPSFTSSYLEEKKGAPTPDEEEFIKAASASLYSGV
jgi:hypothetical protein